ncbi:MULTISPECIES: hypothetical protein [unclassified Novosphingobium]|uniref:hypothetical protein n=1 Tax=unclassified Novosphingobium TaxID=2644732 RepID=UPI00135C39FA|nr:MULTISPECIES: hypothetical protein [unclassified Novosphingobium]
MRKIIFAAAAAVTAMSLGACSEKTQDATETMASSAGDDIQAAATDVGDAMGNAGDKASQAADDTADAAKDAAKSAEKTTDDIAADAEKAANDVANEMANHTDGDPKTN